MPVTLEAYNGTGILIVTPEPLQGDGGNALNTNFKLVADYIAGTGVNVGDQVSLSGDNTFTGDNAFTGETTFNNVTISGELSTTGNILYSDTFWDDIRIPVSSLKVGSTKVPDWGVAIGSVSTYFFDKDTEEELNFAVQLPHNWASGTDLHPHIHWFPTTNGSAGQKVSWGLEYTWVDINEVMGGTEFLFGDTASLDETLVENKHYLTEFGVISAVGHAGVSSMLLCRVFRDATGASGTDSYTNDAGLLEVDFHYQMDGPGSQSEYLR